MLISIVVSGRFDGLALRIEVSPPAIIIKPSHTLRASTQQPVSMIKIPREYIIHRVVSLVRAGGLIAAAAF
jgi:hypothetical protein